ncbi:GNAT family N-acetyltransferase [Bacillus daqingensis]|uniref:GNAT family N-acetyltransferase n=1 Tax=Bacillus daqingensis TaxID=872396 RepID=A0ABV9NSX6_9BACI
METEKTDRRTDHRRGGLTLRPLLQRDFSAWYKSYSSRHPSQHRHDEGQLDMSVCTEEWFAGILARHRQLAEEDRTYVYGVFHENGRHLGAVDFSTLDRDYQWGRIGYQIHNQYWGRGFGFQALQHALHIGFTELDYHRIEAHINLDNDASIRTAEKAGMQYECTRERFIYEFGEWTDNLVYYLNRVY